MGKEEGEETCLVLGVKKKRLDDKSIYRWRSEWN